MKKKKILVALLAMLIVFSLSLPTIAAVSPVEVSDNDLKKNAYTIFSSVIKFEDQERENLLEQKEKEVDLLLTYNGIPCDGKDFQAIVKSWKSATDDFGSLKGVKNVNVGEEGSLDTMLGQTGEIVKEQGTKKLSYVVEFESRKADLEFSFDSYGYVKSIDVNGHYSTGEIAKKAALNTVLGMGTVFIVLIFISFIIYLLKFLPSEEKKKIVESQKVNTTPVRELLKQAKKQEDEKTLIAVITAAIASSENKSSDSFVVRSIRRKNRK